MNLQGIRRWHWVLIALLIGFAMAGVRQGVDAGRPLNGYGECLNDQWAFEAALTDEYRGVRRFKDIVVYPVQMDAGTAGSSRVHLVTGTYFDGHPQSHNGELQAVWTPRAFIAPVPFRTTVERGQSTKAGRTVLDILDGLPGVSYRYAWWQEPRWHYPIWVGGSVLLIGLVWPTVLNLACFGTFLRPREEKGISLWRYASPRVPTTTTAAAPKPPDPLELKYASAGPDELEAHCAPEDERRSPPSLSAGPLEQIAVEGNGEQPAFGADPEDYYPTERKARRDESSAR